MSRKEIISKRKNIYDPVHAHVPGVDEQYRQVSIEKIFNSGDPLPKSKNDLVKERILFHIPGIKIITRS